MITKHNPHKIILVDTRLMHKPDWTITGYKCNFWMPGDDTPAHIGGCLVFTKTDTKTETTIIKTHNQHNIGCVKINKIIYCIGYCRPWKSAEKDENA